MVSISCGCLDDTDGFFLKLDKKRSFDEKRFFDSLGRDPVWCSIRMILKLIYFIKKRKRRKAQIYIYKKLTN